MLTSICLLFNFLKKHLGLGDVTVDHKVAVINFILIMVGLSVVSMSISIIQLHIEAVFARVIRSIDSDFKKNLTGKNCYVHHRPHARLNSTRIEFQQKRGNSPWPRA